MKTFVFNLLALYNSELVQTFVVTAENKEEAEAAVRSCWVYIDLRDKLYQTILIHNEDPVFITIRQ
jgi:hypothetical protein